MKSECARSNTRPATRASDNPTTQGEPPPQLATLTHAGILPSTKTHEQKGKLMKFRNAWMALTAIVGLVSATQAPAQLPGPRYVKKAIFVRIHWDRSFYEYWAEQRNADPKKKNLTVAQLNEMVTTYFNEARADYLNNAAMHNIDLILLNDFDRRQGPMADFKATGGNGAARGDQLMVTIRNRLRTGPVNKTVPNGTTYLVGRTINWVFVWGDYYNQGAVNKIGDINTTDANLFVSTSGGDGTPGRPIAEMIHGVVLETLLHETGHLIGGQHGANNELADCPTGHHEIMCSSGLGRERRFGSANYRRTEAYVKSALQRCSSAFSSVSACQNAVTDMCSMLGDYTQIQGCIDANVAANCQDVCSGTLKSARVVINSLPAIINNATTVNAGTPGP